MTYSKTIPCLFLASFLSSIAAAETTIDASLASRIEDQGENNSGNNTLASPAYDLLVGDSSDNSRVFASAWAFDISTFTTEITGASTIMFSVDLSSILNGAKTVFPTLDFIELATPTGIGDADYENSTNLLGTIDMTGFSASDTIQFDVTSIVKAATDDVGFIMKVQNPVGANNGNGTGDAYIFAASTGQLVVVPEPSSFALIAGCFGLASIMLRRRR